MMRLSGQTRRGDTAEVVAEAEREIEIEIGTGTGRDAIVPAQGLTLAPRNVTATETGIEIGSATGAKDEIDRLAGLSDLPAPARIRIKTKTKTLTAGKTNM